MMQTFLPFPDFERSLRALDFVRCRNQVRETKTLLSTLVEGKIVGGWANHPACRMWAGYEGALARYGIVNCEINRQRGWKANSLPYFQQVLASAEGEDLPWWFGNEDFHRSHRANLCRKLPGWYDRRLGAHESEGYVWPVFNSRTIREGGRLLHEDGVWRDVVSTKKYEVWVQAPGCKKQQIDPDWHEWVIYQAPVMPT